MSSTAKTIHVVLDTNVFISALLWDGVPHQLLKLAEDGFLKCYACIEMLTELEEVLRRKKFIERIKELDTSIEELMFGVLQLVELVKPDIRINLKPHELPIDDDDFVFLQCALAVQTHYIISGDSHLLNLKTVRNIPIIEPNIFYQKVKSELLVKNF